MGGVKRWMCKRGHTLGVVRRHKNGSYHVMRLELFRQALAKDGDGDVIAVAEGTVLNVRCSICGATRTWVMGQDAMERLLGRVTH